MKKEIKNQASCSWVRTPDFAIVFLLQTTASLAKVRKQHNIFNKVIPMKVNGIATVSFKRNLIILFCQKKELKRECVLLPKKLRFVYVYCVRVIDVGKKTLCPSTLDKWRARKSDEKLMKMRCVFFKKMMHDFCSVCMFVCILKW